jgi:hypothetical protein
LDDEIELKTNPVEINRNFDGWHRGGQTRGGSTFAEAARGGVSDKRRRKLLSAGFGLLTVVQKLTIDDNIA